MKCNSSTLRPAQLFHAGFTLIEMVVAVGLLVVVMLGVGVIFKGATDAAGQSERTLDMLSNVRSIQSQIERDVAGLDKSCFLVIRSATFPDSQGTVRRCDLVSFISYGSFSHRTGASKNVSNSPFTDDHPVAPSAFITWGQLALEKLPQNGGSNGSPTDPTVYLDASKQTYQVLLNQVPTGIVVMPNGLNEGDLTLGRNAVLLFPKNVASSNEIAINTTSLEIGAFPSTSSTAAIDYAGLADDQGDGVQSQITQSRVDAAATTPLQIMNVLRQVIGTTPGAGTSYEADHFCYRHAAVRTPYDGLNGNVVNGYFRMNPIALQGVSSFSVEWTDGLSVYASGDTDPVTGNAVDSNTIGTTKWFGLGNPNPVAWATGRPRQLTSDAGGDPYAVVFSYDMFRTNWPVAPRFRFHVADPTGRLPGGRDFTQIVKLPY